MDWREAGPEVEIFFQLSLNIMLLQIASCTLIMEELKWESQNYLDSLLGTLFENV